jgi:hypothetical protein
VEVEDSAEAEVVASAEAEAEVVASAEVYP